jgi:hypothetical protein
MELRQLKTEDERQIFSECLSRARATRGAGVREKAQSRSGEALLRFGNVYGIFDNFGEPVQQAKAGFIVHDLATLPQSFPKPDLSDLPAEAIIEAGDLWSLSGGLAKTAAAGAAVVAGIMWARAMIVYPLVNPIDLSGPYVQFRFDKVCEPILNPYGQALDGRPLWVQPMILDGEKLEAYIRWGFRSLFMPDGDRLTLRFDKPVASRPPAAEIPASDASTDHPAIPSNPAAVKGEKNNGAAAH